MARGHNRWIAVEVVADEEHRAPRTLHFGHATETTALELRVSDREHLVDEQDVRVEMRGDREREPQVHA